MHDVHAGNFIRQKNGILIPIDVFFEGLPAPKVDDFPPHPYSRSVGLSPTFSLALHPIFE